MPGFLSSVCEVPGLLSGLLCEVLFLSDWLNMKKKS